MWRKALISPKYKGKGKDPKIPLNYRPISLISNRCKGFSYIMNKRLLTYLEDQNILVEEQNGFRKGRNCQEHLFSLCSVIKKCIQLNMSTYCCFVDSAAAFDCVDRRSFSQQRHLVCG